MCSTLDVSLHGLDNDQAVDLNDDDNNNNNNIGNLTISLDDIYDSISLCDTSRDLNSKRLTWEEWYVKKAMEEAASGKESARSVNLENVNFNKRINLPCNNIQWIVWLK